MRFAGEKSQLQMAALERLEELQLNQRLPRKRLKAATVLILSKNEVLLCAD
jgi:hypothetical protein